MITKREDKCEHFFTQGKKGKTGSWCISCKKKIFSVEARKCKICSNFRTVRRSESISWYCSKSLGGITPDENATYKIIDGTCWE